MTRIERKIQDVIDRAKRNGRVKDGFVLCDNCDTPASMSLALNMSWIGCAPCVFGEADAFDPADLIVVEDDAQEGKDKG